MPKVFITRNIPAVGPQKLRQQSGWDVQQWEKDEVVPREALLQAVMGCDAILSLLTERIDAELLEAAGPQLKVVANLAVGFDNFVVPEMTERGVIGTNTPDVLTDTTADLAFSLLMATARMLPQAQKYVLDDKWKTWEPLGFLGQDVHHATLGLVGLGRIGAAMARRGAGFEMKVIYYDAYRRQDLEQQYGYEYREFGRGGAAGGGLRQPAHAPDGRDPAPDERRASGDDEEDGHPDQLLARAGGRPRRALRRPEGRHHLGGGLDVTEPEPLPVTDPLLTLDNCLVVPHIASASIKTRDNMSELAADNIINVLEGRAPKTPVNPEVVEQGLSMALPDTHHRRRRPRPGRPSRSASSAPGASPTSSTCLSSAVCRMRA